MKLAAPSAAAAESSKRSRLDSARVARPSGALAQSANPCKRVQRLAVWKAPHNLRPRAQHCCDAERGDEPETFNAPVRARVYAVKPTRGGGERSQ
jgi:hypothetical protein